MTHSFMHKTQIEPCGKPWALGHQRPLHRAAQQGSGRTGHGRILREDEQAKPPAAHTMLKAQGASAPMPSRRDTFGTGGAAPRSPKPSHGDMPGNLPLQKQG